MLMAQESSWDGTQWMVHQRFLFFPVFLGARSLPYYPSALRTDLPGMAGISKNSKYSTCASAAEVRMRSGSPRARCHIFGERGVVCFPAEISKCALSGILSGLKEVPGPPAVAREFGGGPVVYLRSIYAASGKVSDRVPSMSRLDWNW